MKTLSVIIPVYNCRDYLEDCIASLVAVNTFGGTMVIHEIILVDDGSTDGSSELCDQLVLKNRQKDCSVRAIHQRNRGVSAARNVGLRAATGTYVLFVDSDDTIDSQKMFMLTQAVAQDSSIDIAICGMSFDYYFGKQIYRQEHMLPPFTGKQSVEETATLLYDLFKRDVISSLCNKIIRRNVIDETDTLLREDMFLYEDLEFSLRVIAQCKNIFFCPEPIYHYRQTPDEGNAGRRLKRIEHIPEIVDKIEEALIPFGGSNQILLSLYLVLAREKISCSTRDEVKTVCDDFRTWIDTHNYFRMIQKREYAMLVYRGQSTKLLYRREKTRIRHSLANWVKQKVGDFRKW